MPSAVQAFNDVHNAQNNLTGGLANGLNLATGGGNVGQGTNSQIGVGTGSNTTGGAGVGIPYVGTPIQTSAGATPPDNPSADIQQVGNGAGTTSLNNTAENSFRNAYLKSLSPNTNYDINAQAAPKAVSVPSPAK